MKKRTITFLTLLLTASAFISGCSSSNAPSSDSQTDSSQISSDKSDSSGKEDQTSELPYWYYQQTWDVDTKSTCGLNLYNGQIAIPVDLTSIDDTCSPYYFSRDGFFKGSVESINEVLSSEESFEPNKSLSILTKTEKDEDEPYDTSVGKIYVCNLENSTNTISSCYENGWWYISCAADDMELPATLGLPDMENSSELLDAVVEELGRPTYVYYEGGKAALEAALTENAATYDTTFYTLIYEYPEFTLSIQVYEKICNEQMIEWYGTPSVSRINYWHYYPASNWNIDSSDESYFKPY